MGVSFLNQNMLQLFQFTAVSEMNASHWIVFKVELSVL